MPIVGQKKVYLPNFTITLLRTPHLPPQFAQFQVPLNINKLDLRDYLLHAYNVRVRSIRSFIAQQPISHYKPGMQSIRWHRPRAIKKMTVELDQPFVYPEEPKDLGPWDKTLYDALEKSREVQQKTTGNQAFKHPKPGKLKIRQLAESILKGEIGKDMEVEVEKDIKVEKETRR